MMPRRNESSGGALRFSSERARIPFWVARARIQTHTEWVWILARRESHGASTGNLRSCLAPLAQATRRVDCHSFWDAPSERVTSGAALPADRSCPMVPGPAGRVDCGADGHHARMATPSRALSRRGSSTLFAGWAMVVGLLWACSGGAAAQVESVTCAACHAAQQAALAGSVHASLKCEECHGGDAKYAVAADVVRLNRDAPSTGQPAPGFDHGSGFTGRPARLQVPESCGRCHADAERMNPYGLRIDQLARYWTSGHGKALKKSGDKNVAVCTDCHGTHDVRRGHELGSKTHPFNVPATCAACHGNRELMATYGLPTEIVDEYRGSVHGTALLEGQDAGAPTCATCHGNHSAVPPGFANVGAVCGQCHPQAAKNFATSIHSGAAEFRGCVECHGGGKDRHFHHIERITKSPELMIQRYTYLLPAQPAPTPDQVAEAIHPDAKQIMTHALPLCTTCHEELGEDESLQKLFRMLDDIAGAERRYVQSGQRLEQMAQGVVLVDRQRFLFQDAKTHLIELAPLQHTLDAEKVASKVGDLNVVCDRVDSELDGLQTGLFLRERALIPVWGFAVLFAVLLYVKYKQLKARCVKPLPVSGHHG